MTVFAVVLNRPNPGVTGRLQERYPESFRFTDTCYLVQTDAIAETVATDAGIKGDDRIEEASGVVFKLNKSYLCRSRRRRRRRDRAAVVVAALKGE